jgi:TRAP-type C4-dicarboxylate transport system permease small subunit
MKVDMLVSRLPLRSQAIIDSITLVLAMTVLPIVAWKGFTQARVAQLAQSSSEILKIPAYPFYTVVGLGCAMLFLVLVTLLAKSIAEALKKDEP